MFFGPAIAGVKYKPVNILSDAITRQSQDICEVQETLESMESNLQQRKSNKLRTPPKNNVRHPNIVPPDIMDIDTVTSILKTALSSTASKTKSKMVHSNKIADVKIIKYTP